MFKIDYVTAVIRNLETAPDGLHKFYLSLDETLELFIRDSRILLASYQSGNNKSIEGYDISRVFIDEV